MGRRNKRILFIDGFAGPGEYTKGEEGSPIIAMRSLTEHQLRTISLPESISSSSKRNHSERTTCSSLLRDGRLKVLESNQEIQIDEESRHRRNTYPPGTKILFP